MDPPPLLPLHYDHVPETPFGRAWRTLRRPLTGYMKRRAAAYAARQAAKLLETGKRWWGVHDPPGPATKHLRGSAGGSAGGAPKNEGNSDGSLFTMPTTAGTKRAGADLSSAKRKVGHITGGPRASQSNLVPSMFLPGRGAEIDFNMANFMQPLKHKGVKHGTSIRNAKREQSKVWSNTKINQQFSFRAFFQVEENGVKEGSPLIKTRFVCHNVFRHKFAQMCSASTGAGHLDWNSTLGPDSSYIRALPNLAMPAGTTSYGTWPYALNGSNPSNYTSSSKYDLNLKSAMRTPLQDQYMYSLVTKQHLENTSWNLNPLKTRAPSPLVIPSSGGNSGFEPVTQYANAPKADRGASIASQENMYAVQSMPNRQNEPGVGGAFLNENDIQQFTYDVQLAGGTLNYTFANESTCPVVIDIVIHTIKKGKTIGIESVRGFSQQQPFPEAVTSYGGGADFIGQAYQDGYKNYTTKYQGQGPLELAGRDPDSADCLYDAKTPFMPAKALRHLPYVRSAGPPYPSGDPAYKAVVGAPFKQAGRDQFIIAGGAQRSWSMPLCSESYSSQDFRQGRGYPFSTPDVDIFAMPGFANSVQPEVLDEHSYVVSFGFSSVATPLFEGLNDGDPTTLEPTVIDRSASSVNVRVTGNYTENLAPACLASNTKSNFIDGQTERPYYGNTLIAPPTFNANIADAAQSTRSSSKASALIGVGSVNSEL